MGHTPFGYRIEQGRAVPDEEKSEALRQMLENYLGGMALKESAEKAGIKATHLQVKKMLQNRKYLGTEYYPPLLTAEEMDAFNRELNRRADALGRVKGPREKVEIKAIDTEFSMAKAETNYSDPYEQAQYLYSLIEEARTDG